MAYNLTTSQRDLLRWIVDQVRNETLAEEFHVVWHAGPRGVSILDYTGDEAELPAVSRGALDALAQAEAMHVEVNRDVTASGSLSERSRRCVLLGRAFEAVDSDFDEPDTSFVRHLTPLATPELLDDELTKRCLPILGAGPADPALWDSATRTAGVILEERLRDVGGVSDGALVGRALVNTVFGKDGTLGRCFDSPSEREGYRDLYAGAVGVFRNASAHRIVDPSPEDGGAYVVFVNLLLRRLDDLKASYDQAPS